MAYNKDIDYKSLMDQAVAAGDYQSAARYEKARNEKILGEGLNQSTTNRFTGNLDKNDYSLDINNHVDSNAPWFAVAQDLDDRNKKMFSAENLRQYMDDETQQKGQAYLDSGGGRFQYAAAPAQAQLYSRKIAELLGDVTGGTYADYLKGDEYGALADKYSRAGREAMQNTVGELSARTGGLASSYAGVAGQQQYNKYMEGLDDAARAAYDADRNRKLQNLGAYRDAYNMEMDQYNRDRELAFQNYQTDASNWLSYQQMLQSRDYNNRSLDMQEDHWQQDRYDQNAYNANSAQSAKWERAYNILSLYAQIGASVPASVLQELGLTAAEAQALINRQIFNLNNKL